jgi:hypothetical protein
MPRGATRRKDRKPDRLSARIARRSKSQTRERAQQGPESERSRSERVDNAIIISPSVATSKIRPRRSSTARRRLSPFQTLLLSTRLFPTLLFLPSAAACRSARLRQHRDAPLSETSGHAFGLLATLLAGFGRGGRRGGVVQGGGSGFEGEPTLGLSAREGEREVSGPNAWGWEVQGTELEWKRIVSFRAG